MDCLYTLGRWTSAKGYAPTRPRVERIQGRKRKILKSRSDMSDALDFIGWYNYEVISSSELD